MSEIFFLAWNQNIVPRGSFTDMIYRMVMFHQSLAMLAEFPPMMEMTAAESNVYCEPEFLRLYAVLIIADSSSYSVFDP